MFFLPYMDRPRSSCPSRQRLLGSFFRAASGSWVFAHSSLQRTKYSFSAVDTQKKYIYINNNSNTFELIRTERDYLQDEVSESDPPPHSSCSSEWLWHTRWNCDFFYLGATVCSICGARITCPHAALEQLWCRSAACRSSWWSPSAWGTSWPDGPAPRFLRCSWSNKKRLI